ncbi:MAG: type IV secretory system conjugative DNA transfer family protein, partial [Nitrospira sp.]|nr:type IV secretory system conjugative DNA transfer family protein [Nitrospira sp.]
MFHIAWMVFCLALGKVETVFLYSFIPATGWWAVLAFLICAIPGGVLTWYLYWGGRWLATPLSNYFFKNPVAPKKRLVDGVTVRAAYALAIFTLLALPIYSFITADFSNFSPDSLVFQLHTNMNAALITYPWYVALAVLCAWGLLTYELKNHPGLFIWLAKWTRERRKDDRTKQRGDGGDAQFAGFWKETDYPWLPGCILLGESLYRKFWVGFKHLEKNESDDRHILTMAGSRSGKGISRIIPNLLLWPHNAIIIDPKGENATVTAHNPIRAQTFVIDPYELVPNVFPRGQAPSSTTAPPIRAKYNPLQDIDPNSPTVVEDIKALLEAMVFAQSADNAEWERTPKLIIGGVIGHVLTAPEYEKERSLVVVYRLLNSSKEEMQELVKRMRENRALGDFIPTRASSIETAILETKQSFISATRSSLEWLSYPKVQEVVGGKSDFSMYDIVNRPMSIYLCLDMEQLKNLDRFVRIFFVMAFHVMMRPRRPKTKKVLLLMDEFFVLGYLPILKDAAQYCAGLGIKLWPIIQNIQMIEDLYGKGWTNIMESMGVVEAFGLSAGDDACTAAWVEKKLGKSRSANLKLGDAAKSNEILPLMKQQEIEQEFSRESDHGIVFINGADPMVLRRKPYWELFHPSMYKSPPGGVPSRNNNGWTHHYYFGSESATLRLKSSPFDEAARIREVKKLLTATAPSRQVSPSLRPSRKAPGPPIRQS